MNTPPLCDRVAALRCLDDDLRFQRLPVPVQRAYHRLWHMALPHDGWVSELTMKRALRQFVGLHADAALEQLLDAGLLLVDAACCVGDVTLYQLVTPAAREAADVFAEAEALAEELAEIDAICAREMDQ